MSPKEALTLQVAGMTMGSITGMAHHDATAEDGKKAEEAYQFLRKQIGTTRFTPKQMLMAIMSIAFQGAEYTLAE
jgi:hypothetical protein